MKIIKILSAILSILFLISAFSGCREENGFPVTVGDTEITEPPKTVAALSEQAASAIYALGYKSYLVGAPAEFLNTEIKGVTNLGEAMFIDFEAVYELSPDVLIIPAELTNSVKENLKARSIKTILLKTPTKYDEVAPYYAALSKLFLGEEKYIEAYDPYIGENERIISETKASLSGNNKRVALFVEEGYVATGDTIAGTAMERAGINNIAATQTDYMMSLADIKAADPEVIFCPEGLSETILGADSYKEITAVKNGAVYEVDVEALVYATEGFAATLQSMSKYLLQ
ncbi:MAG: ABC transporter substrate-binding protein [Clostridia bacterium]|nr:ABC transporter substrate-binding protein [Clostridia bacterium]